MYSRYLPPNLGIVGVSLLYLKVELENNGMNVCRYGRGLVLRNG